MEGWTVASWVWGSGVKMLSHLGPAEYTGLSILFGGMFIYSSALVWDRLRWEGLPFGRSYRFRRMAPVLLNEMRKATEETPNELELYVARDAINRELQELGIPLIPDDIDNRTYSLFLAMMIPRARDGDIDGARRLPKVVRQHPNDMGEPQ